MKLNAAQIAKIDETLVYCGIIYDDIKLELIDHIASEVEAEMQTNQTTFSEAFNTVFDRWKIDFKRTRAFFSLGSYYPRIVKTKFENQLKLELLLSIAISSLLFISLQLLQDSSARLNFIFWIKKVFFFSFFVTIISSLTLKFLNRKAAVLSTYNCCFNYRFLTIITFLGLATSDSIPREVVSQNLYVAVLGFLIVFLFYTIHLGFKHYQFQKKLSIQL